MDKRLIALSLLLLFIFVPTQNSTQDVAHGRLVVVIILDGFNPYYAQNTTLDALAKLSVPMEAIYPSITIANHLAFASGLYPNETNIPNTYFYDPNKLRSDRTNPQDAEISRDEIINSENFSTIYTVGYEKGYLTALVTAKYKLISLLGPNGQATIVDQYKGYVDYDNVTNLELVNSRLMNETYKIINSRIDEILKGERAYLLVNLPGTDYIGHNYGPFSPEYATIAAQEIELVYQFISRLKTTSIRSRSLVIVTGDHSMCPVDTNAAVEDTVTHALTFPELAANGIPNVGIGTSGNGVLLYLLNNDTATIENAVNILRSTGKVDGIRTRVPVDGANGTLADIGLNTPYAGDLFVSLKPPYYFSDGELLGAHGGYCAKTTHARVFSGRDVIKSVDKLTSIDVAAMSYAFLGLEPQRGDASRVLDTAKTLTSVSAELPPFVEAGSTFYISISYSMPSDVSGKLYVTVYDDNGNKVLERSVSVSGSGVTRISLSLNTGVYQIVVSLQIDGEEVAGYVYVVNAQQPAATSVKQPIGKIALTLAIFIALIVLSIYLAKRIK